MKEGKQRLALEHSRAHSWNFIVPWRVLLQADVDLSEEQFPKQRRQLMLLGMTT